MLIVLLLLAAAAVVVAATIRYTWVGEAGRMRTTEWYDTRRPLSH